MAILCSFFCGISTIYALPTASIELSAASPTVPADGVSSVAITAILLDSTGMPSTGNATFTTNIGQFPNKSQTSGVMTIPSNGIIVISLTAGINPGVATITCIADNGIKSVPIEVEFTPTGSILLTALPQWIPSDGVSSSVITAVISNTDGTFVANDTDVTFSTTSGTFSNGLMNITVQVKNGLGSVGVSLIASNTPGVAQITCTANSMTQHITVSMGVGSIELTASPTSIPADGSSSTIKAVVLNSQNLPVPNGTAVTFTILSESPSDVYFSNGLKEITIGTATQTTEAGTVITSLIAGTKSGTAKVRASSNGVTQTVSVSIGLSSIAAINLKADPTSIPADGNSSTTITATCVDITGYLFNQDGKVIKFTTTLGTFSNNKTEIEVITEAASPITGMTVVTLIAGTKSGIALVMCETDGVKQSTNVRIGTTVSSITLSANPTSLPADGISSSTITAILKDITGVPIDQSGLEVKFTTTNGTFSNNETEITVTTATSGTVVVSLIAGKESGIALIVCESGGVKQSTNVTIGSSATIAAITLSANPTSLPADGISSSTITAILKDITGTPITQSGIPVTFKTTLGHFSNGTKTITVITANTGTATGAVVVSLISDTTSGTAVITCESGGVIQTTTVNIGSANTEVASIILTAAPSSFPASDTTLFSTITATLYNTKGEPVPSGVTVSFATNLGFFSTKDQTVVGYTNSSGVVVVQVFSGGSVGTAQISASAGGINRYVFVSFTGSGLTADIVLTASSLTINSDKTSYSTISASLYDMKGQPVISGTAVNFTTSLGYFSNRLKEITIYTNSSGVASVALYSGSTVGTAQVSASSNGVMRYINIGFTGPGPAVDIVLSASLYSISSDKLSYSTISATVYDYDGNVVNSGVTVEFTTTLGYFSNSLKTITAFTNIYGIATAYLYSGSFVGIAQISASSNGVTRYTYVNFTGPGPTANIEVGSASTWIPADGYSKTIVAAKLTDSAGNAVSAGTSLIFMTTQGVFSNGKTTLISATPDATGIINVYLTSGREVGIAVVTCSSGSITGATTVSMAKLEFETEPNNDKEHADAICFGNVYLSQLFSPYEEDWYAFTITNSSRISINFLTTAIPKIAGDCKESTTVGTYRVDIRDRDNNILMSYQNIDCSLDNGIWETGVVPAGSYYIVVYCPRLPDNGHYLSSQYYLAVFNELYGPCDGKNKLVNSASLSQDAADYQLHIPIINSTAFVWVDLLYDPIPEIGLLFRLINYGEIENLDAYSSCNMSTLFKVEEKFILHIPQMTFNGVSYQVDLNYVPTTDGKIWFALSGVWLNK